MCEWVNFRNIMLVKWMEMGPKGFFFLVWNGCGGRHTAAVPIYWAWINGNNGLKEIVFGRIIYVKGLCIQTGNRAWVGLDCQCPTCSRKMVAYQPKCQMCMCL